MLRAARYKAFALACVDWPKRLIGRKRCAVLWQTLSQDELTLLIILCLTLLCQHPYTVVSNKDTVFPGTFWCIFFIVVVDSGLRNRILTGLLIVWKSRLTSAVHKGTLKHLPFPPSLTTIKVPLSKVLNPPLLQCICSVVNSTPLWLHRADPRWRCLCINDSNEQQHHRNHSQLQAVNELIKCTYCKNNGNKTDTASRATFCSRLELFYPQFDSWEAVS